MEVTKSVQTLFNLDIYGYLLTLVCNTILFSRWPLFTAVKTFI